MANTNDDTKTKAQPTIERDAYDDFMFGSYAAESSRIQEAVKESDAAYSMGADIFASFFKSSPKLVDEPKSHAHKLMSEFMGSSDYRALRGMTKLDDLTSAIATTKCAPTLIKQVRNVEQEMERRRSNNPSKYKGAAEDHIDDDLLSKTRAIMRVMIRDASDDAEKWNSVVHGFGIDPGELQKLPPGEKIRLAESLGRNPAVKRIAELVGRFRNMARGLEATSPSHGFHEVVDVGQGSEISRLLSHELIKYSRMRTLFYKDMLEGGLSVYNLRGVEPKAMGPMVICLDVSGSMSVNRRDEWSKAAALALIQVALRQNRPVRVAHFAERVYSSYVFKKPSDLTIHMIEELVGVATNGAGTEFHPALGDAFDFIQSADSVFKPADIVFITDGMAQLNDRQLKVIDEHKKKLGVRIHAVGIDMDQVTFEGCAAKFADDVSTVSDTGDVSHGKTAFSGVISRGQAA